MDKEKKHFPMDQLTMEISKEARKTDKVNSPEQTAVNTLVTGPTTSSMEEELSSGPTATDLKDNGKKVKCTV